jgi:hypothetical protein
LPELTALSLSLLDRLETAEARLLTWGVVDAAFSSGELEEAARETLLEAEATGLYPPADLIQYLLDGVLLWQVPGNTHPPVFRTRSAEAIRLASRLKQMFKPEQWQTGSDLVADYRYHRSERRFPLRTLSGDQVAVRLEESTGLTARQRDILISALTLEDSDFRLSEFQYEACESALRGVASNQLGATLVSAGTGSGKTIAFLLPALLVLAEAPRSSRAAHVLAVYPRNELLKDQLRAALAFLKPSQAAMKTARGRPVSVGAYFGAVPRDANDAISGTFNKWATVSSPGVGSGLKCPFLDCPSCGESMIWPLSDARGGVERLVCASSDCTVETGEDEVRLTRQSLRKSPPDILFSSTEMLNRAMPDTGFGPLFGVGTSERPSMVVLDEVHTYEGAHGAHVGLLLRRWRNEAAPRPHFVGLSATIVDGARFMEELTGVFETKVRVIEPSERQMMKKGAEYTVVLRGNSAARTSLLSTTIQAAMLFGRILDPMQPANARPSEGVFGSKAFLFTDNLDVTNRLFDSLNDAEGWWGGQRPNRNPEGSLATLRGDHHPNSLERHSAGQSWQLCQSIGHSLHSGYRVRDFVGRTSSQDKSVDAAATLVVSTASLEVGFDDPDVGVVIQHKSPSGAATYLQRKGRAGRTQRMRPWTVIVLSDFGRDRRTYENFEELFDPRLSGRLLPIRNPYVLRIQATFALIDWLRMRVAGKFGGQLRYALSAPMERADVTDPLVSLLKQLLEDAATRDHFRRHLRASLEIDDESTLDRILWGAPRSIILEVVPTLLKRLETKWHGEYYRAHDPLPEFLPRALFEDLNLPELELHVPNKEEPVRMGLRQGIAEFAPGKVSRRFAIWRATEAHWVEPPPVGVDHLNLNSVFSDGAFADLGTYSSIDGQSVSVVRPLSYKLTLVPDDILPSSNSRLRWFSCFAPSSGKRSLPAPSQASKSFGLVNACSLTHSAGAFVEVCRFAPGADVSTSRRNGDRDERHIAFEHNGDPAALGFVLEVDGLCFRFRVPDELHSHFSAQPELLRALRVERFRDLLLEDPILRDLGNQFSVSWLVDAALATVAHRVVVESKDIRSVVDQAAGLGVNKMLAALKTVFGFSNEDPDSEDDNEDEDKDDGASPVLTSKKLLELQQILQHEGVEATITAAARCLVDPLGPEWDDWLRERVADTTSAAFLQACERAAADAAGDSLLADIEWDTATPPSGFDVWITESTPGGAGAIQRLAKVISEDDQLFYSLVAAALEPSDRELATTSFVQLLKQVSDSSDEVDDDLQGYVAQLREADTYEEKTAAFGDFTERMRGLGFLMHPSVLTAVNLRLLRPGSSEATDRLQHRIAKNWDTSEERLGFALPPRVFAELESHSEEHDEDLRAVYQATGPIGPEVRYRYFVPLLWPHLSKLRAEALDSYNPYAESGYRDRLLLSALFESPVPVINLDEPTWLERLTTALAEEGHADLKCPGDDSERLRRVLLELLATPIDTGSVLSNVRVRSYRREGGFDLIRVELPEAFK